MGYGHGLEEALEVLFQILVFLAVMAVIYWVVKSGKVTTTTPKSILKERLAKGELTTKEYRELLAEIQKDEVDVSEQISMVKNLSQKGVTKLKEKTSELKENQKKKKKEREN